MYSLNELITTSKYLGILLAILAYVIFILSMFDIANSKSDKISIANMFFIGAMFGFSLWNARVAYKIRTRYVEILQQQ